MRYLRMTDSINEILNNEAAVTDWSERRLREDVFSDKNDRAIVYRGFPGVSAGVRGDDFGSWYTLSWSDIQTGASTYTLEPIRYMLRAAKNRHERTGVFCPVHIAFYVHGDTSCRIPHGIIPDGSGTHDEADDVTALPFATSTPGTIPKGPDMNNSYLRKAYADVVKVICDAFCNPAIGVGAGECSPADFDLGKYLCGLWPGVGVSGETIETGSRSPFTSFNIGNYHTISWAKVGLKADLSGQPENPYDTSFAYPWYDYGDVAHPELGSWLSPVLIWERWVRRSHQGIYIMGTGNDTCNLFNRYAHWCEHHDGQGIPEDQDGYDVRNYYTSQLDLSNTTITSRNRAGYRRVYERLHALLPDAAVFHSSGRARALGLYGRLDVSLCNDSYWGFDALTDLRLGSLNSYFSNATIAADTSLQRMRQIVVRDGNWSLAASTITGTRTKFSDWGLVANSKVFFPNDDTAYNVASITDNTHVELTTAPASPDSGDLYILMANTFREVLSSVGHEHAWAANYRDSYWVPFRLCQLKAENVDTESHIFEVLWALQWRNKTPDNARNVRLASDDGWHLGHREFTLLGHSHWDFLNHYNDEWCVDSEHPVYGTWRIFHKTAFNTWRSGYSSGGVVAERGMTSGLTTPTSCTINSGGCPILAVTDTTRLTDDIVFNVSAPNSAIHAAGAEAVTYEDMKLSDNALIGRWARSVGDATGGVCPLLPDQGAIEERMPDGLGVPSALAIGIQPKLKMYGAYGSGWLKKTTMTTPLEIQPFHTTSYIPDGHPVIVCLVICNTASDLEISYNAPIDATAQIYNSGYPNSQVPTSKILVKRQNTFQWRRVWLYSTYLSTAKILVKSTGSWVGVDDTLYYTSDAKRNYIHAVTIEEPWGWYQYYLTNKGVATPDPVLPEEVGGTEVVGQAIQAVPSSYPYAVSSVSADIWGNRLFYDALSAKIVSAEGQPIYTEVLSSGNFYGKSTVSSDGTFYIAHMPTVVDLVTITKLRCARRITDDPLSIIVTKDIIEIDYDDGDTHIIKDMSEYDGYLYTLSSDIGGNSVHSWKTDGSETATLLITGDALADVIAIDVLSSGIFLLTGEPVSRLLQYSLVGAPLYSTDLNYVDYSPGLISATTWLAMSPNGRVYMSDNYNNRVQVFDNSGGYFSQFGSLGSGNGEFDGPAGIAASATRVYVVDAGNRRVQIFDKDGVFISEFGSLGMGDGEFTTPTGIAYSSVYDRIAVADVARQDVQIFSSDGAFIAKTPAGLNFPTGVTSWMFYFYVADTLQHKIVRYNWGDATYDSEFGSYGTGDGEFNGPVGITNTLEHIYVADSGNHRVQMFTPAGVYESEYGSNGTGINELNTPYSIASTPNAAVVFVGDSGNYRLVIRSSTDLTHVGRTGSPGSWVAYPHIAYDLAHIGHVMYITFPISFRVDRYGPDRTILGSFNIRPNSQYPKPPEPYAITGISDGTHTAHLVIGMSNNLIYSPRPAGNMSNPIYFGPLITVNVPQPVTHYNQSDKYAPDGGDTFMLTINGVKYSRYAVNWEVPEGDGLTW